MSVTEEELKEIIKVKADIEKVTTISSDSRNLLTRIPTEIREFLKLSKGNKLRWLVDTKIKQIKLEIIKENEDKKKERN